MTPRTEACRQCDYPIDGLADADVCPECGTLAGMSRYGPRLHDAPAAFVAGLARGALLIEITIVLSFVLRIVQWCVMQAADGLSSANAHDELRVAISAIFDVVGLGPGVCWIIGWWMLTRPDPRLRRDSLKVLGTIVRVCLALTALAALIMIGIDRALQVDTDPEHIDLERIERRFGVVLIFIAVMVPIAVAGFFGTLLYLRALARRLDAPRLRAWATHVMWILPASMIVPFFIVRMLAASGGLTEKALPAIAWFDWLYAIAWYAVLLGMADVLRRRLADTARRAAGA